MVAKRFYKSLRYEEENTDQDWVEAQQLFDDVNLQPNISASPIDGQTLSYDALTNRWINKTPEPFVPFLWFVYKAGTIYKALGSNGLSYSGSDLKIDVWDNIKSNPTSRTRIHFLSNSEPYDITSGSTLDIPSAAADYYVSGESMHGVRLRPLGNNIAMQCTNLRRAKFDNIGFYIDQGTAYTSDIFRVIASTGGCESIEFSNIKTRHDNGTNTLSQTGRNLVLLLTGANPNISWINAHDCHVFGSDSAVAITSSSVTGFPWCNENMFTRFHATHTKYHWLSNMPLVGGAITASMVWRWVFRDCSWQTTAVEGTTADMFRIASNTQHRGILLDGCHMWDAASTNNKFLRNESLDSRIAIINCEPIGDVFMSGAAWDLANGKWNAGAHVTRQSALSHKQGVHKASGNGTQTVFNIPHGIADYIANSETVTITPKLFDARPRSLDAKTYSDYTITADATNIILTYAVAPITGTNNLTWQWEAREFV